MPVRAIICRTCAEYRPIYIEDPRYGDHVGHDTHPTEVWHGFEMWNNPRQMYCADDERLDRSWFSARCTCPQQLKFGESTIPKKGCKIHGKPWQEGYEQWLAFQPFEEEMIS